MTELAGLERIHQQAYLSRAEGVDELVRRWEPGEHLTELGPTGRGKSTLMAQVLGGVVHDQVVICCPKGADPAYAKLGSPTMSWPPKRSVRDTIRGITNDQHRDPREGPAVWRLELPMRSLSDLGRLAHLYHGVLAGALARKESGRDSLLVLLDDSRLISDPRQMDLGPLVAANLMIGRSKRVSIVNNYQAPRWVPREALDQVSHVLIWRNRDRDVVKRLSEVADLDPALVAGLLGRLDYYDALWVDARRDELFVIGGS